MTPKACQAYANFWYAQAQAGQEQFLVSPTTTFPWPLTHTGIKLSKLVKEARLLECEIFSGSVDAVVVRN